MNISHELLKIYLDRCTVLTEQILDKVLNSNHITEEENKLAKEINHIANILSAIYFYRQDKVLSNILSQIPDIQKQTLEPSLTIIWKYLSQFNDEEISHLATETIQASSVLDDKISNILLC